MRHALPPQGFGHVICSGFTRARPSAGGRAPQPHTDMNKTEFALKLLAAIKDFLSWAGIPRDSLDKMDEIIFIVLILKTSFNKFVSLIIFTVHQCFNRVNSDHRRRIHQ